MISLLRSCATRFRLPAWQTYLGLTMMPAMMQIEWLEEAISQFGSLPKIEEHFLTLHNADAGEVGMLIEYLESIELASQLVKDDKESARAN